MSSNFICIKKGGMFGYTYNLKRTHWSDTRCLQKRIITSSSCGEGILSRQERQSSNDALLLQMNIDTQRSPMLHCFASCFMMLELDAVERSDKHRHV